jgi:hypothetical protein
LERPEGVANQRSKVPDDEERLVPKILELTQLIKDNKVPKSKVGTGWINAQLDT